MCWQEELIAERKEENWKYTNYVIQSSLEMTNTVPVSDTSDTYIKKPVMCDKWRKHFVFVFVFTAVAAILYECRLGCLESEVPQETQDYIAALHLMFSSFKTTMYAGAIPKWLRSIIPKPWEEFCDSWDGLFKFSKWFTACNLWLQEAYQYLLVYL